MPLRSTAARIASPPSVVAESDPSAPPSLPNGVRAVDRTTVFDFMRLKGSLSEQRVP
jgi:hypothetical protein